MSLPLLAVLAVLWFQFPNELDAVPHFKAQAAENPAVKAFLTVVTDWGNVFYHAFFIGMLIWAVRTKNQENLRFVLIVLAVQLVVALICVHFVKHVVGRPRPGQGMFFDPITTKGSFHSFPSGHTTEFVGWSLPLVLRQRQTLISTLIGVAVALVGFSRIYLGWHHPSDVFFGWALGSFGGFAAIVLVGTNLFRKRK